MTPAHRVVMNTGILYARMAITVVLSLYTTRVVLYALGVDDFGIFNLVGGAIAMLTFLNASMAAATQRFMSFAQGQGDEGRQHQIFNVSMVMHAGIALIVLGLLQIAGFILFNGILKIAPERMHAAWMVYQFAVASTFITILGVPYDAVINARENMLLYAVLGVIEAVIKLAIALIIVNATIDKLELYGLLMAILTVALLVARGAYCQHRYRECKLAPKKYFSRPVFKEMTTFGAWSLLGSSTSMVANYGQGIVLNIFFSTSVNAAQGITAQVSGQLGAFASTMLRALNPFIVKSEGAGKRNLMLSASMMGSKLSFFLLLLLYIPIIIEMPYLLSLWLKTVPAFTQIFCTLLLIRNLIEQLFITMASSIAATGNIKHYQIAISILTILPLPISYYFFQLGMQPYWLYIVFIVYSVAALSVTLYFSNKFCNLSFADYLKDVILRCVAALIIITGFSSIPLLIIDAGWLRMLSVSVLSLAVFSVVTWLVGFCEREREYIRSLTRLIFIRIMQRKY